MSLEEFTKGGPVVRQNGEIQEPSRSDLKDFAIGAAKGLGDTVQGIGKLGRSIQAAVDPFNTTEDYDRQAENLPWYLSPFSGKNADMIDETLRADNPMQVAGKVAEFAGEVLLPAGAISKTLGIGRKAVGPVTDAISRGVDTVADAIQKPAEGALQTGKEFLERIPRAGERVKESLEEASARAERIKNADPVTAEAIKSNLDDRFINTVAQADPASLKKYKEVLDIADDPATTIKPKERPEIVAGETASEQFKFVDKARKNIGEQIGEAVDQLSTKGAVDVLPAHRMMRDVLRQNGILPDRSGVLQFTGRFTPSERTKIQELYTLATEGGEALTPRQVYDMDKLFSKLQREARFENVGEIFVQTPEGEKSLFSVFRDIYSNQLEAIAPEIKPLNQQYRLYKTMIDDLEKTIVKSGNYQTTKGVDEAEFAQTNLRRLFSESNTAADYRAIYENLDRLSRQLGYEGARADDLAAFAYELRKLYPEATPRTGFEGSIRSVVGNLISKVTDAGAPNVEDQRKALRALIEEALKRSENAT